MTDHREEPLDPHPGPGPGPGPGDGDSLAPGPGDPALSDLPTDPVPVPTQDDSVPAEAGQELPIPAPPPAGLKTFAMELLGDVLKFALCFLFLYTFVFHVSVVKGSSMKPTFIDGDRLVVDTLTYRFTPIERYDVVVHENPNNASEDFIKRVVALPGDVVHITRTGISVNGKPLEESYLPDYLRSYKYRDDRRIVVPEDTYFVLGDNRPASKDSRDLGPIPNHLIKGKIRVRLWPISSFQVFTDRPVCLALSIVGIGLFCFVGIPYLIRSIGLS